MKSIISSISSPCKSSGRTVLLLSIIMRAATCSLSIKQAAYSFLTFSNSLSAFLAMLADNTIRAFNTALTLEGNLAFEKPFPSLYQSRLVILSRETAKLQILPSPSASLILSDTSLDISRVALVFVTMICSDSISLWKRHPLRSLLIWLINLIAVSFFFLLSFSSS